MSASDSNSQSGGRSRNRGMRKLSPYLFATGAVICTLLMAQTRLVQSQEEADQKSTGCVACHGQTDSPSMHPTGTVRLGCADCHGGDPAILPPVGAKAGDSTYEQAKKQAHPQPRMTSLFKSSANPVRAYANWLKETKEYIQFVNPGDLRVAEQTCGLPGCHVREVRAVHTSMMTHGAMLWEAALYNNGAFILQGRALRRELFARWASAAYQHGSGAIAGIDSRQGRASPTGSASALGNFAARQRAARVRARRRASARRSEIRIRKKIPGGPTTN